MNPREEAEHKYLTFLVGDESYGLDILHIKEIIGIQKTTRIPEQPPFVKGVINLRGNVIPVMDARLRFGMVARPYDDKTCTIVIHARKMLVGFIVDTVSEVMEIPPDQIDIAAGKGDKDRFIRGLGKVAEDVKIILDAEPLLFSHTDSKTRVEEV